MATDWPGRGVWLSPGLRLPFPDNGVQPVLLPTEGGVFQALLLGEAAQSRDRPGETELGEGHRQRAWSLRAS